MTTEINGKLAVGDLRESPFNPRKTYREDTLRELADSFAVHGVLSPLLVRPIGAKARFAKGTWVGVDHFEVVDGHRRFRAAKRAKIASVPVVVRQLDDREAREIQLIANAQREDVPPSEESAAYRELVAAHGVEETAKRVGKPVSVVRERSALAALPAWFLAAVDAGFVSVSAAGVVARVPGEESRKKAAACVALGLPSPRSLGDDWRDELFDGSGEDGPALVCDYREVLSYRDAKQLVREHFSRELKGAPFSRKSLDLVPEAGSCDACPKRAGNDPELVKEGVRADTCTDPDCFARKVEAYREQEIAKATAKGAVDADLGVSGFERPPRGWCRLDAPLNQTELLPEWAGGRNQSDALTRQMAKLLGDDCPQRHYAFAKGEKLVLLVKTAEARKTLQAAGVLKKPERRPAEREKREPAPSKEKPAANGASDWETKRKVGIETAKLAGRILREYGTDNFEDLDALAENGGAETNAAYEALLLVARFVAADWVAMGEEREAAVVGLLGVEGNASPARRIAVAEKLAEFSPRQLLGFLLGACGAAAVAETSSGFEALTADFLAYAELDRDAMESQAARIVAGEESADAKVDAALAAQEGEPMFGGPSKVLGDPAEWKDLAPERPAKARGTVGELAAPPVHAPGSLPLAQIDGVRSDDAQCLLAVGCRTLADLSDKCDGDLGRLEEVLGRWQGAFREPDVERIATAVRAYLSTRPAEVRTSAPLTAAAYNARVAELKAASPDWFRDDGVRDELAALWGDGCNAFGVFPEAREETVARAGKAVAKVLLATGKCGLWLSSACVETGQGGGSSGLPCVTDTAYDTRAAAREAAVRSALACCESHQRTTAVQGAKDSTGKLADQLRKLLGETPAKPAKKKQPA